MQLFGQLVYPDIAGFPRAARDHFQIILHGVGQPAGVLQPVAHLRIKSLVSVQKIVSLSVTHPDIPA